METRGLLFIPDISGFTRFVNEIEIEHSRYIIQQLLEVLINANELDLEISEVEGDAILFYKFGERIQLETLYKQVEKMFRAFHQHLMQYDQRKICQCKACVSAIHLTLKVITHYGEFTLYNVKQFKKLIGKDVIIAHQLLKNDIHQHEYWLVTKSVLRDCPPVELKQWMHWDVSVKQTENGEIAFHYTQLSELKNEITPTPISTPGLSSKIRAVSVSKDYGVDVKTLWFTVVHFEFRPLWQANVKAVDEVEHFLPGIGSKHRHLLNDGRVVMKYTSSFVYNPEGKTMFSETDEANKTSLYFTTEKTGANTSRLTLELYLKRNLVVRVLFGLLERKKTEKVFAESLQRLDKIVKEMVVPLEF